VRAPLSWIRDFTPVDAPVDEIVGALNQVGLEVDAVEAPGAEVLGVRAAKILEVLPHPDADRLQQLVATDALRRVGAVRHRIRLYTMIPR